MSTETIKYTHASVRDGVLSVYHDAGYDAAILAGVTGYVTHEASVVVVLLDGGHTVRTQPDFDYMEDDFTESWLELTESLDEVLGRHEEVTP